MSSEDIRNRLTELHAELEKTPQLDAELRELLMEVDGDIHALLSSGEPARDEVQGLRERLEALAADFDAQHPNTNIVFRELIHALGRMGI
jgi:ElaB/YqjD/DUF883 family membrane-anchored ribosome-binding protein